MKTSAQVSFQVLCYSPCEHLTSISLVLWCVHDIVTPATHPSQLLLFTTKTSKNIPPFITTYNSATTKFKEILANNWYLMSGVPRVVNIFANAPSVFVSQRYKYLTHLKPLRKVFPCNAVVLLEKALHTQKNRP